jgi:hypothetical protein
MMVNSMYARHVAEGSIGRDHHPYANNSRGWQAAVPKEVSYGATDEIGYHHREQSQCAEISRAILHFQPESDPQHEVISYQRIDQGIDRTDRRRKVFRAKLLKAVEWEVTS